jgi:hypothetical protein
MSDRDDLHDRLDAVADEFEEPEIIETTFQIYELVPDEVSEDNKGELIFEDDITWVDKSDDLPP